MKLPVMVLHMSIPHIFRRKDWFRNFLAKVEWEDDWPVVNPGVGMLEKEICLPGEKDNSMPGELNEVRNYSFKNMTDKKLPLDFMMLRNPQPNAYTIDEQEECLKLPAKDVAIGDNGSPSYVAVRQKHHRFQAETEFLLKAGEKGDRAGIAYLQNSQNYLLAEYGENMQFDAYMNEKPGTGDIWDCVNEESIGFSQEVYLSDVHGGERHNNYINTINPGETVTVRMAFKVPEEKLNEMYFTLSNYGGSHFYDETSLQLGYVDIRQ